MLNRVIVKGTGGIKVFTLVARLISYSSSKGVCVCVCVCVCLRVYACVCMCWQDRITGSYSYKTL